MDSSETSTFQHRVVRVIAILGIILACNGICGLAIATSYSLMGSAFVSVNWSTWPWNGLNLANNLVLAIGSFALIKWKSWGRVCVIVWAICAILTALFVQGYFLYHYLWRIPATTQPAQQPDRVFISLTSAVSALPNLVFPLAVLVIMNLKEVRQMWARRPRSGFEVLPVQPLEVQKSV